MRNINFLPLIDLQMEREKARLNRFIGVKEINNKAELEKNEKLRKSLMEKEKKYKKTD